MNEKIQLKASSGKKIKNWWALKEKGKMILYKQAIKTRGSINIVITTVSTSFRIFQTSSGGEDVVSKGGGPISKAGGDSSVTGGDSSAKGGDPFCFAAILFRKGMAESGVLGGICSFLLQSFFCTSIHIFSLLLHKGIQE
jgi:hypothetical protein